MPLSDTIGGSLPRREVDQRQDFAEEVVSWPDSWMTEDTTFPSDFVQVDCASRFHGPQPRMTRPRHSFALQMNGPVPFAIDHDIDIAWRDDSHALILDTSNEDGDSAGKAEHFLCDKPERLLNLLAHSPASMSWRKAVTSASPSPSILLCRIMKLFT
ncbi:MAG: hypothetical protein ABI193_07850 [Minicystis sp.]